MLDKAGKYYWPEPVTPVNQLGNWKPIGYQAKFKEEGCLPIYGDEPYDITGQTFNIDLDPARRFTYLPVLTNQVVNTDTLFKEQLGASSDILLMYDWSTGGLWLPGPEADPDLDTLKPGLAYLLVHKPGYAGYSVTYPGIDTIGSIVSSVSAPVAIIDNGTAPWNSVVNTSQPHFILFANEVLTQIEAGDVIGAFNQYNECVGLAELNSREELFKLLAMGDDPVTEEIEGFEAGEDMNFKLYRPSTDETFELTFTYDMDYPNYDNLFAVYGVSKVVDLTMNVTSIGDDLMSRAINVYPNPADNFINIASDFNIRNVSVINFVGQMVYTENVNGFDFQVNVSNYVAGIYMVRIETTEGKVVTKRITVE